LQALIATIVASGATPAIPTPLIGAAMIDETCVPWPNWSCTAALFEQSPLPISTGSASGSWSNTNEHDRARSRFGAMSGWVRSTPLSMTPTTTPRPVARAWVEASAPMSDMSHWQSASGSLLAAANVPPNSASQIADAPAAFTVLAVDRALAAGAAMPSRSARVARAARERRITGRLLPGPCRPP